MPTRTPRVPHARRDPIRSPQAALAVITLAASSLPRFETVAFLLDDAYRGTGLITVVSDTSEEDSVLRVAEVMAELAAMSHGAGRDVTYVVIATIRPGGGVVGGDALRWRTASDIVDSHGMTLLEWFVLGRDGVEHPRDLIGEPDRWPRG